MNYFQSVGIKSSQFACKGIYKFWVTQILHRNSADFFLIEIAKMRIEKQP